MKNLGRINDPLDVATKQYVDTGLSVKQDTARLVTLFLSAGWSGDGPYEQTVSLAGATAATVALAFMDAGLQTRMEIDGLTAVWMECGTDTVTVYAAPGRPAGEMSLTALVFGAEDEREDIEPNAAGGNTVNLEDGTATETPNAAGGNTVDIGE